MKNVAGFDIALSNVVDIENPNDPQNPFTTLATFVFADDKPNSNKQAIPYDEFPSITATAIGMPIKIRFTGAGAADHAGSVPIGVIRSMEEKTLPDNTHQLIATATLWAEEFPEEVQYIKKAFADGEAPGISFELGYKDSITEKGIQWIKNVVTLAATFVKNPAYGTRTRLLALAADQMGGMMTCDNFAAMVAREAIMCGLALTDVIDSLEKLSGESETDTSMASASTDEGGNQMEEELQQAKALAASLSSEIEALKAQITDRDSAIEAAKGEIAQLKQAALIDSRTRKFVESGFTLEADAEKADKKKALWASLSDEQFDEYLSDLVAAKAAAAPAQPANSALAAIAQASSKSAMPKPEVQEADITNLKSAMRELARPYSA